MKVKELNRKVAPQFKTIDKLEIIKADKTVLKNGVEVFSIHAGSQELTKVEFVFKAGMYHQSMPLLASATNNLMETGTVNFTADQISEEIDFYGSFLESGVEQDKSSVVLYALNKYLDASLSYVSDLLQHAIFPEDELRLYLANKKQKHQVNSQKVNVLARRRFSELIFGPQHPYGVCVMDNHFEEISRTHIQQFYADKYINGHFYVLISGALPKDWKQILEKHLGQFKFKSFASANDLALPFETHQEKKHLWVKEDAIQSAIRIGRPLFNKLHPDYFGFQFLNTILGGYFGSRLMANIREDKGYTYGIGSSLSSLGHGGVFSISTEVGVDVTGKALEEIYKELALLREELVDEEELETVRNYILGQFLRSVDGPFSLAEKFKGIYEFNLGYDYFDSFFNAVKTMDANTIRDLANRYLKEEDLIELVVGKR